MISWECTWARAHGFNVLVWTALWAEENRFGSPLNLIHKLLIHQSEPPPSHGSFVLSVDNSHSCSLHYLALTSQAELAQHTSAWAHAKAYSRIQTYIISLLFSLVSSPDQLFYRTYMLLFLLLLVPFSYFSASLKEMFGEHLFKKAFTPFTSLISSLLYKLVGTYCFLLVIKHFQKVQLSTVSIPYNIFMTPAMNQSRK